MTLIVVKGDDGVEFFALTCRERRVRHQGTFNANAALARRFHRWFHEVLLFTVAKKPMLARVGIQAANAQETQRSPKEPSVLA